MTEPSGLPSHVRQRIALDSDSGCWHWIGGCNPDGYGTVRSTATRSATGWSRAPEIASALPSPTPPETPHDPLVAGPPRRPHQHARAAPRLAAEVNGILTRKRLDVPEVHSLLGALDAMLDDWAETVPGSPERMDLWRRVHHASAALSERAYGPAPLSTRIGYWLRPYDPKRDARCWRWQRLPCYVLVVDEP